jgi:hypothetical protein
MAALTLGQHRIFGAQQRAQLAVPGHSLPIMRFGPNAGQREHEPLGPGEAALHLPEREPSGIVFGPEAAELAVTGLEPTPLSEGSRLTSACGVGRTELVHIHPPARTPERA